MASTLHTAFGDYDGTVVDHIVTFADANDLPPIAMLAMGLQESNLDVNAVGDVNLGGSYGLWQIFVEAHGGPPSQWLGLSGLDNSMAEMKGRWLEAFATTGSWAAWLADPIAFQQTFAPAAQGSIGWSHAMAAERVGQAIVLLVLQLKAQIPAPKPAPEPWTNDALAHVVQLAGRLSADGQQGDPDWAGLSTFAARFAP